jgi:dimethylaniline monooxygenase (N-oxide forming)
MLNVRLLQILRNYVPTWLVDFAFEWKLDQRFSHANYGLKPAHSFFGAHPTINDELPNRIACGTIVVKPNIRRFTVNGIEFDDGTIVDNIDAVILSTGYTFTFPMLESGTLISVDNNHVDLYKYMYIPTLSHHTLALIGLIQPLGSIMPIAEMQSRVYFDVLTGRSRLPSTIAMIDDIKQKRMDMEQRYVVSRRHTIQVDYVPYMDELADLIGARPNIIRMALNDPLLAYRLLTGPNLPYVYRLCGPHRWFIEFSILI